VEIHFNDIKVGDLVKIRSGMAIPCDGVVISGTGITTNESAMTGESIELKKEPLHLCIIKMDEKLEEEKFK
jgi:P-type E1-E2 ATPase